MKFTLDIETGNEAMMTGFDIAEALIRVAEKMKEIEVLEDRSLYLSVYDTNGNKVGTYSLKH